MTRSRAANCAGPRSEPTVGWICSRPAKKPRCGSTFLSLQSRLARCETFIVTPRGRSTADRSLAFSSTDPSRSAKTDPPSLSSHTLDLLSLGHVAFGKKNSPSPSVFGQSNDRDSILFGARCERFGGDGEFSVWRSVTIFCATRILNISRPSGWLDGQKHLRCRCSLPLFDARNHSCLAPRVRRNNRTPPQDGFGRCPRGRSQPHRGLRQAHGEEDQCRREEGASPTRDITPLIQSRGIGFLPLRIRRVDVTFAGCVRGFDARVWGEVDARGLSPCV